MSFIAVALPPGVYKNGTEYQARGRWKDSDGVRWTEGTIRPIGGWAAVQLVVGGVSSFAGALSGVPRGAVSWRTSTNTEWFVVGLTIGLTAYSRGELFDITPAGLVPGRQDAGASSGIGSYGYGAYGFGLYSTGSLAVAELPPDTWTLDTFGNFLVGVLTSDGKVYSWASNSGVHATVVAGAPITNTAVVVTPERFLFVLGAGGNMKKVQWPSRETLTDWMPTSVNDAGGYELQTNGVIVCGKRSRTQTLIWTTTDVHAASFIGGDFIYSFTLLGENCGIISPNAASVEAGVAFWMGTRSFFVYDGFVKTLPCDVSDFVFGNINYAQRAKIFAYGEPEFGEVWWFYPSTDSVENDRYVVYNYRENHWAVGSLARAAGVSRGAFARPILADKDGMLFEHETGNVRGGVTAYLESGPIDLGLGDQMVMVRQIVPDERTFGEVQMRVFGKRYPTDTDTMTALLPIHQPTDCRLTARHLRIRIAENTNSFTGGHVDWRVGTFRLDVVPRGLR